MIPYYLDSMGAGQAAFNDGLLDLGFKPVPPASFELALARGDRVLVHGWWYPAALAEKYPRQIVVLWHTGFAGNDLLGAGAAFARVAELAKAGLVTLMMTETRDRLPAWVAPLTVFWSPDRLRALLPSPMPERQKGHVVAGLHGDWASSAKNTVGNVWGAVAAGATVHTSQTALTEALKPLVDRVVVHPSLSRRGAVALVAACELLIHVSLADSWSFQALEALYAGTPVLVSEACGISQVSSEFIRVRPTTLSAGIMHEVGCALAQSPARLPRGLEVLKGLDAMAEMRKVLAVMQLHAVGFDL